MSFDQLVALRNAVIGEYDQRTGKAIVDAYEAKQKRNTTSNSTTPTSKGG